MAATVGRVAAPGVPAAGSDTALDVLHQAGVLRARFPKPEAQEAPEAVLVNTAGGLTGGDKLDIGVKLGEGPR